METSLIIIIIGLFIFFGHYLSGLFGRKGVPDVLGLMLIGLLIGPVSKLVSPEIFGQFGSLFSNLVLIFILFESGTELRIASLKESFKDSAAITTIGFLSTTLVVFLMCFLILDISLLSSLFIGSTLGGTSAAVVVGLVKQIAITSKTATTLIVESAESDVFTLAVPISILGLMMTGQIDTKMLFSQFITSLVMAVLLGVMGAFSWSYIINKIQSLKSTKFSTPAFLFIVYGLSEYLGFSGPLTALTFGIAIGNLEYFEPKLLSRIIPNQSIVLPDEEKDFFSQIVFLLRTFFFIFIGINIRIDRLDWLMWGAIITICLFLVRLVIVKLMFTSQTPVEDRAIISMMIPKGLGAAVIATLPLQNQHPDGIVIQAICFSVILFSTMICVILFYLLRIGISLPFYQKIYPGSEILKRA
ncbi:MAG: cation:proton antiporter [Saprospiraceae bacterium]|nr:cation:proton antiporter [Saprospiraceae bacterium]